MKVFIKTRKGKYYPSFKFGNQSFVLADGYETEEEAEWMCEQLKVCFSNYALNISRKYTTNLIDSAVKNLNKMLFEKMVKK